MGDSRNVIVNSGNGLSIALYTHWDGGEILHVLAAALDRGLSRWSDSTYLTRIIFSEMIQHSVLDLTGYGIEAFIEGDTAYCEASPEFDPVVDIPSMTVTVSKNTLSFRDFVDRYAS